MKGRRNHMTHSIRNVLRTCLIATLLVGAAWPAAPALAQVVRETPGVEEERIDSATSSLEPIRLFVKELNRSGELRRMTREQVTERLRNAGLFLESDAAATAYVERLVRDVYLGKLSDGERSVPPIDLSELEGTVLGIGGGTAEIEPNDSTATAQAVICGEVICGSISPATDVDYYVLTPGAQTEGLFVTAGDPGGDTVITVYNAAGSEIGHNDDSPGGADFYSTCIVPCLASGSAVYVKVSSFGGLATITNVSMTVVSCTLTTDVVEIEPNGTYATATAMGPAPVRGCGTAGAAAADVDLMSFSLAADSLVTIINGPANADVSLRLFLPTGPTLWFDNNNGAPGGSQITVGLRAGTYINRARSKFGNSPAQNWSMPIQVAPPTDVELEPDGTVATASPLNCNQTLSCVIMENLTAGGDLDYYSLTIPAGPSQPIALITGPTTADTNLTLIDTDGTTVLAFNEDIDLANSNVAAEIDATLAPGTYFVLAQGHIGSGQVPAVPYTLTCLCPTGNVESEDNGLPATADAGLACGATVDGRIGVLGDVDYWSLTLVTEQQLTASIAGTGGNSVNVAFIALDGTTVISSGTNGATTTLDAGSYYVRVTGGSTAGHAYMLNLACVATPVPVDVEVNDTIATANASSCADDKVGLLMPRDTDIDYWSFSLGSWTLVTVTVDVPDSRSSVNPFVRIVDASGNPIRTDNNSGGGVNARIKMSLPPGTWYAAVTSATGGGDPDPRPDKDLYEIHIDCEPTQCLAPQPFCINNGFTLGGSINVARQMACYTFTTSAPNTRVSASVSSITIEPSIFLTDGSDNYLDYDDDDGDGEGADLCYTLPAAGTYLMRVQNFGSGTGSYAIRFEYVSTPNQTESEPNDGTGSAQSLNNFDTVHGALSSGSDVDYYSITLAAATNLAVTASSCAGHDNYPQAATDLTVSLYNSGGGLIVSQNTDNGADADEALDSELSAGSYFVAVSGTPGDTGEYDLTLKAADARILLEPTAIHPVKARCSDLVPIHARVTNLRSALMSAQYTLQLKVGANPPSNIIVTNRNLTANLVVDRTFNRTLSYWLGRAGIPCPGAPTPARFVLFARQGGNTIAIDSYDFTILP